MPCLVCQDPKTVKSHLMPPLPKELLDRLLDLPKDIARREIELAIEEETRVAALERDTIAEMIARRYDLDFQLDLVRRMMAEGKILPFPFERAVVLLGTARCYEDAIVICRYVETWCENDRKTWDGHRSKVWLSPRLMRCVSRIAKLEVRLAKSRRQA
jgi:hypothetical protein